MNSEHQENFVLKTTALYKLYSGTEALSDFNLTLAKNKIVGLLGPNGSGKTTLLKLIAGLLSPSSGSISVCGNPIGPKSKADVAFLPDRNFLHNWMTVEQLLKMFSDFFPDFNAEGARQSFSKLNISTSKKFGALSKGNQEKVQLILTMCRNARLYLLDEPIGGVDPATRDYILDTIVGNRSNDATVLISTHLIADVESVLDEAIFIKNSRLLLHSPVNALRDMHQKTLDEIFREEFKC